MGIDDTAAMPWTRRGALGALAATAAAAAFPARGGAATPFPDDALHGYARAVGADRRVAEIGRAAAGAQSAPVLEAALRARIPGARDEAGWRAGLLEAAREDIVAGAWIEVQGRRMPQIEGDFLGLAAHLQPA